MQEKSSVYSTLDAVSLCTVYSHTYAVHVSLHLIGAGSTAQGLTLLAGCSQLGAGHWWGGWSGSGSGRTRDFGEPVHRAHHPVLQPL